MLKKVVNYENFDGVKVNETLYFNLTKAEVVEMEMSTEGGLTKYLEQIVEEKDPAKILEIFKKIILKAYGEKSPDGKHFLKSSELAEAFSHTEAYSELFMELLSNPDSASAFIEAIIPKPDPVKN